MRKAKVASSLRADARPGSQKARSDDVTSQELGDTTGLRFVDVTSEGARDTTQQ